MANNQCAKALNLFPAELLKALCSGLRPYRMHMLHSGQHASCPVQNLPCISLILHYASVETTPKGTECRLPQAELHPMPRKYVHFICVRMAAVQPCIGLITTLSMSESSAKTDHVKCQHAPTYVYNVIHVIIFFCGTCV